MTLHKASAKGTPEDIRNLMDEFTDIDEECEQGWTPLMHACDSGKLENVLALLNAGADINAIEEKYGMTPIKAALGAPEVVQALITADAYLGPRGWNGETALMYACTSAGTPEDIRLLATPKDGYVEYLDYQNREGMTALMIACIYGGPEAAEVLLAVGADLGLQDLHGSTALDHAKKNPDMTDTNAYRLLENTQQSKAALAARGLLWQ